MARITLHRTVDAPIATAWEVLTDHELYAEAAPNLATVEVVGDGPDGTDAEGMIRRCVDVDGNEWTETCTRWNPGRAYAVSVDVDDSDFHRRLFRYFEGEWRVAERDDGDVRMTIQFDFEPRYGPLGRLITAFFRYKAPGIVDAIFDRWEAEIEARTDSGPDESSRPLDPDGRDERGERDRRTNVLYR